MASSIVWYWACVENVVIIILLSEDRGVASNSELVNIHILNLTYMHIIGLTIPAYIITILTLYMYMYIQYRSDARYKAHVIYRRLHEEANALVH